MATEKELTIIRSVWGHASSYYAITGRKTVPVEAYNGTVDLAQQNIKTLFAEVDVLRARVEAAEGREAKAMQVIAEYAYTDGAHHKQWVIDQVARALLGDEYASWADGDWDTGIAP